MGMNSSTMDSNRTAIVGGGGPAGLTAAARLAEGGVATTLLEAGARLGGRAASERRDGFDLNQGPHALYEGWLVDAAIASGAAAAAAALRARVVMPA
jgi:phytoene dehydrogenase-like protein